MALISCTAPKQFLEATDATAAAAQIAKVLTDHGFRVLYAGGWVRDLLMGKKGNDIDIATDASPEELISLFPNAIQVGISFGVVRVICNSIQFEIATFRKDGAYLDGRHPSSISICASPEEDAQRRDFSINGLFYDPASNTILDYVNGREDIQKRVIRTVGAPEARFQEDRLRIIRAIRFKNSLQFSIEPNTWRAIEQLSQDIAPHISPERIWQEFNKMDEKRALPESLNDLALANILPAFFPHLRELKPGELAGRLNAIKERSASYSPLSTVLSLALLFLPKEHALRLRYLHEQFHLSNEEKKALMTLSQIEVFEGALPPSELTQVALLSLPHALEACQYLGAQPLKERYQPLEFWIQQRIKRQYLVSGQDLIDRGCKPGLNLGKMIENAFSISLSLKEKEKQKILDLLLQKEGLE